MEKLISRLEVTMGYFMPNRVKKYLTDERWGYCTELCKVGNFHEAINLSCRITDDYSKEVRMAAFEYCEALKRENRYTPEKIKREMEKL